MLLFTPFHMVFLFLPHRPGKSIKRKSGTEDHEVGWWVTTNHWGVSGVDEKSLLGPRVSRSSAQSYVQSCDTNRVSVFSFGLQKSKGWPGAHWPSSLNMPEATGLALWAVSTLGWANLAGSEKSHFVLPHSNRGTLSCQRCALNKNQMVVTEQATLARKYERNSSPPLAPFFTFLVHYFAAHSFPSTLSKCQTLPSTPPPPQKAHLGIPFSGLSHVSIFPP